VLTIIHVTVYQTIIHHTYLLTVGLYLLKGCTHTVAGSYIRDHVHRDPETDTDTGLQ